MRVIGSQIAFDTLDYEEDPKKAKKARDDYFWRLKKEGKNVKRFVLRGQIRPYSILGSPDGRVRDVYFIQVNDHLI